MKYIRNGIKLYTVLLLPVLFGCTLDDDRIEKHYWKYGEGYHLADVLVFNQNNLQIKNDTISKRGNQEAVIMKKEWKFPVGFTNRIYIQSIKTGEIGIYHEK